MAVVTCSSCKIRINVKDEMLGNRVKCPKCRTVILLEADPGVGHGAGPAAAPSPWKKVSPPTPIASKPMAPPPIPQQPRAPAPITRTPSKPKSPPPPVLDELDELDEVADEPLPRMAKRRAPAGYDDDDDDDIEDAEPDDDRPRRGSRRDREDDDDRPRSRPGSAKWDTARLGMHIALTSAILAIVAVVGMETVKLAAPATIMGGFHDFDDFDNPRGFQPNMGGLRTLGAMGILCMTLLVVAVVCHVVAMCMSISAPAKIASGRARKAVIFLVVAVVISILTMCLIFGLSMAMFNRAAANRNLDHAINSGTAILIVGFVLWLVASGFSLASGVFWMLYHASVADAFRRPNLRAHAIMLLIAALVVPFIVGGVTLAIRIMMFQPGGMPGVGLVFEALFTMIAYGGLVGWYIYLNRSLARLM